MKKDKAKLEVEILEGIYEELLSLQNQIFAICLMMKKKGIFTAEECLTISAMAKEAIDKQKEKQQ